MSIGVFWEIATVTYCIPGQVERERPFWLGVPNSGSEGDVVFWSALWHQRHSGLAEDGQEGQCDTRQSSRDQRFVTRIKCFESVSELYRKEKVHCLTFKQVCAQTYFWKSALYDFTKVGPTFETTNTPSQVFISTCEIALWPSSACFFICKYLWRSMQASVLAGTAFLQEAAIRGLNALFSWIINPMGLLH